MKRKPIDKIVYFDTNIYNHLLDNNKSKKDIAKSVSDRTIGIFISRDNIMELVRTYKTDPQKMQRLFQLTWDICLKKPTQPAFSLTNAEFRHLVDPSVRISIYSNNQDDKNNFMAWWKQLSENPQAKDKEITAKCDEIKESVYAFCKDINDLKKKKQEINKEVLFAEFLEYAFKSNFAKERVAGVLEIVNNSQITIDMVLTNLSKMKGFLHWLYYSIAYYYHLNHAGGHPKPSDSRDFVHAIYAGYSDIFVSDDEDFMKYLRYIPGNKHLYLNLSEFLEYLKNIR